MAIKYTSLDTSGLTIPNSDQYISINGSWTSAPTGGGIITFSGSAVRVVPNDSNIEVYSQPGELLNLGDLGTFFITSYSKDDYIGYTKITYSITCILGYLTKISPSIPLAACIYQDKTVNDVLLAVNSYLGITFALPRASTFKLHEPIWLKENQTLISLLNEILSAAGCIIYSVNGQNIFCKTLADFYEGLSGESNSNTISRNFVVNARGSEIRFIELSGTKTIKEPLTEATVSTVTSEKIYYNINNQPYNPKTITTVERTFPAYGESGPRKIVTTVDDEINRTKTITTEIYEDAVAYTTRIVDVPITECFPYDPARILSRVTEEYITYNTFLGRYVFPEIDRILNYLGIDPEKKPLVFWNGNNNYFNTKITTEKWEYNTEEQQIFTNPDTHIPAPESVKYSKVVSHRLLIEGSAYLDPIYGARFNVLEDEEIDIKEDFMKFLHSWFFNTCFSFPDIEKTETVWNKPEGSYIWNSTTTNYESAFKLYYETNKKEMLDFAYACNIDEDLAAKQIRKVSKTTPGVNIEYEYVWELDPLEYSSLKTNLSTKVNSIWNRSVLGGLMLTSTENKESEPSFSTFPSPYRIHNIPWQNREIFNNSIIGETLSLNYGRFSDFSTLRTVAREIKNAKDQRINSLSVTNINELFRVGEIDAPSFSISVDGLKSSGVYLNG